MQRSYFLSVSFPHQKLKFHLFLFQIIIGDTNIKDINIKWLRKHIGIVSQEPVLFDTTIAENIALGLDTATQKEIEDAAVKANVHEFIQNLPNVIQLYCHIFSFSLLERLIVTL